MAEERLDSTDQYHMLEGDIRQLVTRARELGLPFLVAFQAKYPQVDAHLPFGSDPDLVDAAHALGVNKYTRLEQLAQEQRGDDG
jgi:hypothetical protein